MSAKTWYASAQTTQINKLNICYKRSGKGPTLICIHGFPSTSLDFEALWPSLCQRFNVVTLDLIGLGKSAKPQQKLSIKLQADCIKGLALKLNIEEAHILAHDMGDTIAQELLAREFDNSSAIKWRSCVFLNGGLFPETHRALFVQKLLASPIGSLVVQGMTKKALKRNFTNIFSKAHPPSDTFINDTWALNTHNNGLQMIPKLITYMKERKVHRERWLNPLVQGVVPLRLINGIEDPISGQHAAERYAELIPNADVIYLKNSGHYPHVETPNEVLKAFFEFHDTHDF